VSTRRSIPVRIGGQEYRIRSDAEPGTVERAAALVDETMARLRSRTGSVDSMDVAVLAALNLANQLVALRDELRAIPPAVDPERVEALVALLESAVAVPASTPH